MVADGWTIVKRSETGNSGGEKTSFWNYGKEINYEFVRLGQYTICRLPKKKKKPKTYNILITLYLIQMRKMCSLGK